MALTVCLACDKTYGDAEKQCPHCFTHNFFCDDDPAVLNAAVKVLVTEIETQAMVKNAADAKLREEKLRELKAVAESILPPQKKRPWYKKMLGIA